ncbi:dehydrogenase/reductase SDR family member on chromosome X [Mesocricetus auratus]|uniref:Dehydrogenase/reductase SDR family member on chromosome X n=1 Tax=Mesocricetus auratus TaxID=10036 RepID=A0ABM2WPM6_MESAU|nr:dehydrogenase/reductase SDR family member on chromosome X [Mesocricetus auratus]
MSALLAALRATVLAYAVGAAVLFRQLLRRLRGGFRPPELRPQPGRVAIVTGGTDGIGRATATQLAALGMGVVIAANDEAKGQEVAAQIRAETENENVRFLPLDLASLASVRKFARDFLSLGLPLHALVNNAGVMLAAPGATPDGFEPHLGVNFLGHFLLTRLLLGRLRASASRGRRSRVVTLASATHYVGRIRPEDVGRGSPAPPAHAAYARSKLALVLFARRLQRLLAARGDPVTSGVADPGVADTALFRNAGWGLRAARALLGGAAFKTPEEGAWTSVLLAAAPAPPCGYVVDEAPATPLALTGEAGLQDAVWAAAERAVGGAGEEEAWPEPPPGWSHAQEDAETEPRPREPRPREPRPRP